MGRLSEAVKRRIVEHLACYRSHPEVVALIAEEFAITLTPHHVRVYDPSSYQFAASNRWVDYYELVQEQYAKEIANIPIAQKVCRLIYLQKLLDGAMERKDYRSAMKVLEIAAKEVGCFYEKRH